MPHYKEDERVDDKRERHQWKAMARKLHTARSTRSSSASGPRTGLEESVRQLTSAAGPRGGQQGVQCWDRRDTAAGSHSR
jgi:hypothetical protein